MRLLVLGANSDMAAALAAVFAREQKADLYLASRQLESLEGLARDLSLRYQVQAQAVFFDALDQETHAAFYRSLNPPPDGVVVAFGYLGDQDKAQREWPEARRILETNLLGAVSILEPIAQDMSQRKAGFIIALASVAGERGRMSNYIYGAAKGGLLVYLDGLRHRLSSQGVRVLTVQPGFVATKMTQGMDLPGLLTASPQEVAADVYRAWRRGRSRIYSKWFWRWIMLIIRCLPQKIMHRTKL